MKLNLIMSYLLKSHIYATFYIQLEDTGRYSCLANSPAGDDDKEFLVRVHGESQKQVMCEII